MQELIREWEQRLEELVAEVTAKRVALAELAAKLQVALVRGDSDVTELTDEMATLGQQLRASESKRKDMERQLEMARERING